MSETGRWRAVYDDGDQDEWTCGEAVEVKINGEWLRGRFEADGHGEYYVILRSGFEFYPRKNTLVRRPAR